MNMELTSEEKEVLIRTLSEVVEGSSNIVNAVYISPAQQLRNQANRLEQREKDYPILVEVLKKLK